MIYRTRVSGWIIFGWVTFWTLCAFWAGEAYWTIDGVEGPALHQLSTLTGLMYMLLIGPTSLWLWAGVTVNLPSIPYQEMPATVRYPNLNTLNADTWTIYRDDEGHGWVLHYSIAQFRALSKLIQQGYDNLPYHIVSQHGFSRKEWETLRIDLVRAGLATNARGKVIINEAGKREIFKQATRPLPHREVEEESL